MSATTAFWQLQQAVATALASVSAPVHVNRSRPLAREEGAAILLRLEAARRVPGVLGPIDWRTRIVVTVCRRAADTDSLLLQVNAALDDIDTSGLGVIELDVGSALDWAFDAADTPHVLVDVAVDVHHRTDLNLQPLN